MSPSSLWRRRGAGASLPCQWHVQHLTSSPSLLRSLVTLIGGVLYVHKPGIPCWRDAKTSGKARQGPPDRDKCPVQLGFNAQASAEWGDNVIFMSGRGKRDAEIPCHVFAFRFLFPPTVRHEITLPSRTATGALVEHLWQFGEWTDLGAVDVGLGARGRVGGTVSVVQGRLYVSGGVDEQTNRFDGSVARWEGRLSDLASDFPLERCMELVRLDRAEAAWVRPLDPEDFEEEDAERNGVWSCHTLQNLVQAHLSAEGQPGVPRPPREVTLQSDPDWDWSTVPGLELPTAMHAHSAITIPLLPRVGDASAAGAGSGAAAGAAAVSASYSY